MGGVAWKGGCGVGALCTCWGTTWPSTTGAFLSAAAITGARFFLPPHKPQQLHKPLHKPLHKLPQIARPLQQYTRSASMITPPTTTPMTQSTVTSSSGMLQERSCNSLLDYKTSADIIPDAPTVSSRR